jgi:hypothetical protein
MQRTALHWAGIGRYFNCASPLVWDQFVLLLPIPAAVVQDRLLGDHLRATILLVPYTLVSVLHYFLVRRHQGLGCAHPSTMWQR